MLMPKSSTRSKWTNDLEKRFDSLITKEALGTISKREIETLERLVARRRASSPRLPEEFAAETAADRAFRNLVGHLRKFKQELQSN